jgi:neutral ceramidase
MGYARPAQVGHGIHQRQFARAFIMAEMPVDTTREESMVATSRQRQLRPTHRIVNDAETSSNDSQQRIDPSKAICFISIDACMGSDLLNLRVLERLESLLPIQQYSSSEYVRLCHIENLSISATHTHSTPAGYLQYALYQITSWGLVEQVVDAYAEGIAQALKRAYDNLQPGHIHIAQDLLFNASINRSPTSYLLNPQYERNEYSREGDTDKTMLQLMFQNRTHHTLGLLNWFAVHGTSMNKSNTLISGDNKGYASYMMEKHMNGKYTFPGKGDFVAAFASTNFGDVSPNTNGARCLDTGLPCDDLLTSTCRGRPQLCVAHGPGKTMFESTEIIGRKQFDFALHLMHNHSNQARLDGPVRFRHSFVEMSNLTVILPNGQVVETCPAALGYSFVGGTTDGTTNFDITQGVNTSNPFYDMLSGFASVPTHKQIQCHHPKPILLNVGSVKRPYNWVPHLVPVSVFQIGDLYILNVPAEFTTMAGRRLRKAIHNVLVAHRIEHPTVVIAGVANSYTHYVTTYEEYQAQRYEAASTLYGPYTLNAYIQELVRITSDLIHNTASKSDAVMQDLSVQQISLVPPVEIDAIGWGYSFGSVAIDAREKYVRGNDTVVVSFRSANPRNNLRLEGTFLTVDFLTYDKGVWKTLYVDGDWCTQFVWKGGLSQFEESFAEIYWEIPTDTEQGLYRVCHYGTRKTVWGTVESMLYRLPAWLVSNILGSAVANALYHGFVLAFSTSKHLQLLASQFGRMRYEEFEGCSRPFLVTST